MSRTKRILLGVLLAIGLGLVGVIAVNAMSSPPDGVGVAGASLAPCPDSPNCVSTEASDGEHAIEPLPLAASEARTIELLSSVVNDLPGGQSVLKDDNYLHSEFRSSLLRFVDDVEFLVDKDDNVVHIRSASRTGRSDLGVNRARVEQIRSRYLAGLRAITPTPEQGTVATTGEANMPDESDEFMTIEKTDAEWRQQLTDDQYYVTRKHGTERAFTGPNWDNKQPGTYKCVCCDLPLFSAATKYESGTGWPSFWQPLKETSVETRIDRSLFSTRTEVHCRRCKAHLGHVFPDGPDPTGLRYCMNGVAMDFEPEEKSEQPSEPDVN